MNKGTAFTKTERNTLGLLGLLPTRVADMEEQVQRIMENYEKHHDPLDKHIFLSALHDRNETLFYRVLVDHLVEMTPIVYTPVVGTACQRFGHIYRKNRGMYISYEERGAIRQVLDNWPQEEVDIIVVSDGSRILGLGDLGANGMGIPIGKLALYVAGAGIYPERTLPILLDTGTNNEELLNDPLYLGLNHKRISDDLYYEFVDEFVHEVEEKWPKVLIQWEDFTNQHAFAILNKYRDNVLSFNDDIQGTGAVALAGLLCAMRVINQRLSDQRIVFYGAGSAAIGIADMIAAGMVEESHISLSDARKRFWFLDSKGLVTTSRLNSLEKHKIPYAQECNEIASLIEVINEVRPSILVGVSGQPQTFTKEVITTMYKHNKKPIVFALSNPTSKSECTAEQVYTWTMGNALFASGSPFPPVEISGKKNIPGQGNNMYIFPGMGLGAIIGGLTKITNGMFYTAARTLAHIVTEEELNTGTLYPDLQKIHQISAAIATAVCRMGYDNKVATNPEPVDILSHIKHNMYFPEYFEYVLAR